MKKTIIFLFICVMGIHSQWVQQVSGTTNFLSSVFFQTSNLNTAYACGSLGTILKTTNNGTNWNAIFSGTQESLRDICFFNQSTGIAVGYNGVVLRTTNGGGIWTVNYVGSFDHYCLSFIDANTGFVSSENGVLFKTTNAGLNWNGIVINSLDNYGCYFLTSTSGFTCGPVINTSNSSIKRTTNNGSNWQEVYTTGGGALKAIDFFDTDKGWSCGYGGRLARTTNGGANWVSNFPGSNSNNYNDIYFCKPVEFGTGTTGWLAGDSGKIYISTNAGVSWTEQPTPTTKNIISVKIIGNLFGWAVGSDGTILYTSNGGNAIGITPISSEVPDKFTLSQNYPNPFNPATNIVFKIAKAGEVTLKVYDNSGKEIETLVNSVLNAGTYKADWNADNYASGIYYYKLITKDFSETKKMVLVK